jgi:replicative DNA helicase
MGRISRDEFQQLSFASQRLAELPLYIDDTPALSIAALRTRARRLKRRHDIGLIVVDYLQLLQGSGRSNDNRVNEISEISRGLKTLAKELSVPVIALSQLSRAVESREDKRPHAVGPARIGLDRAGRRHGLVHLPRGILPRRDQAADA